MGSSIAYDADANEKNDKLEGLRETISGEGSEFQRLHIYAVAESPLERIDIIRSGHISVIPLQGELEWTEDRTIPSLQRGDYCYIRVVQRDGGVAWSSPIFGALVHES
jgi:hypothetical protein